MARTLLKPENWLVSGPPYFRRDRLEVEISKGKTNEEIAEFLNIDISTLYRWRMRNEEFANLFTCGREINCQAVKSAMFKTALGFEYEEEELDKHGNKVLIKKYCPPNVKAQENYLRTYDPEYRENIKPVDTTGFKDDPLSSEYDDLAREQIYGDIEDEN